MLYTSIEFVLYSKICMTLTRLDMTKHENSYLFVCRKDTVSKTSQITIITKLLGSMIVEQ